MSMKVLVAESDWRFGQQVANYLESHAHHVVSETEPQQVLDRASHWQPDLVIVSAELALGGLLPALKELDNAPAVLLVGRMDRYDLAWRAWQAGGDELLMKPIFRNQELHVAIITALENAATGKRQPTAAVA